MHTKRRRTLHWTLATVLLSLLLAAAPALAQVEPPPSYLDRPITVIVGWGVGGGSDLFARSIARAAEEIEPNIRFTVVNQPGAAGTVASAAVQAAPADGYTIWAMTTNYPINVAQGINPYGPEAWEPIARIQHDLGAIQVSGESPHQTIEEFLDFARENPGRLTVGGTGSAGFDEASVAFFATNAGVELSYVPYESAGEMHADLLGGHIDAIFEEIGPTASLLEEGMVRALVVFAEERLEDFPDVPTAPELGIDQTFGLWRGILVKAGTPPEIVAYLTDLFRRAMDQPSYQQVEREGYLHLRPGFLGGEEFIAFIEEESERFEEIFEMIGQ